MGSKEEMRLINKVIEDATNYTRLVKKVHMARYRLTESMQERQYKCSEVIQESDEIATEMITHLNQKKCKAKPKMKSKDGKGKYKSKKIVVRVAIKHLVEK